LSAALMNNVTANILSSYQSVSVQQLLVRLRSRRSAALMNDVTAIIMNSYQSVSVQQLLMRLSSRRSAARSNAPTHPPTHPPTHTHTHTHTHTSSPNTAVNEASRLRSTMALGDPRTSEASSRARMTLEATQMITMMDSKCRCATICKDEEHIA